MTNLSVYYVKLKENKILWIVCFLGDPADWFLGPCVFGGLCQCEPVWHRAGYPGCEPDIWHFAEPDSGAGYSRLVSGSTFPRNFSTKLYAAKIFFSVFKLQLLSKLLFSKPFIINIRFYNVMNYKYLMCFLSYQLLPSCDNM